MAQWYPRLKRALSQSSWVIFLTSQYCATARHLSWCCGRCTMTFWGLSVTDGTMQAAFSDCTAVNFPNISAISACGWTNRSQEDDSGDEPSDQRLECICLLEYTNNPVLNHVVPAYQTHQGSAAGTLETHIYDFSWRLCFLCLPVCCTDWWCKNQSPYFFSLLIIQYCNIFNIK